MASALIAATSILIVAIFKTKRDIRNMTRDLEDLKPIGMLNRQRHRQNNQPIPKNAPRVGFAAVQRVSLNSNDI